MTKRKVSRAVYSEELKTTDRDQVMYADIMTIDGQKSLLSVSVPLQLIICTALKDESEQVLDTALQGQLQVLRERGFTPKMVHVDPQSMFVRLRSQYLGVLIDVGGAKDYVPVVDAKIRRVKEMHRAVKARLAWKLPKSRVSDLLTYCVSLG